jgi:hypothetical protein
LNGGARGTETFPCLVIYAPSEVARQALHAKYGNAFNGVLLMHQLSSPEPAVAFGAAEGEVTPDAPAACESWLTRISRSIRRYFDLSSKSN